jgi:hypothetical protein
MPGAWAQCAGGSDVDALVSTIARDQPRPALDMQLRDADGLPVPAARIASLDVAAVEAAVPPTVDWSPAALRALAALSPLLDEACAALAPNAPDDACAARPMSPPPVLHVLTLWPPAWSVAEAEAAQAWLAQRLQAVAAGLQVAWPATQASPAGCGVELLLSAQQWLAALQGEGREGWVLVLACHSDLDDAGVLRLEREGRLYAMPHRPEGVMPGEAAAVLLLRTPGGPADGDGGADGAPVVRVSLQAQPGVPGAAASRRPDAARLQALLAAALEAAGLEATAVASISADAAQHHGAGAEVHALMQAALAQLDPVDDLRLLGSACGHAGAVAPLLALAAAWARCRRDDGRAALAVSAAEGDWRLVGVVTGAPANGRA